MSSIVKMYDASNNDVYPITHLRAVRDSNGTTLESMIQGVNETTVGYYECNTAGSTPEKTITIDSSVILSVRISCKVKFAEKNTGANATMNINNTGAKPLFYNGVRAAANNSWYTNEIVDLYFDGTNYQAKSCADTLEYDVSLHQTHEITEVTTTTRTVVYNGDVTSGWENETSVSDSSVNGYTRTETNTGNDNDTTTVDGPTAKYDTESNKTSVVYVTKRTLTHVVNDYTFDEAVNSVPMSYRHGGLKLSFISNNDGSLQNSDNKYVQYRLMNNTWSTTVTDWQGVDEEPTIGSNNLVKSGGVADSINKLKNAGYLYAEIATPTTNPCTPDGSVFYIANGKGTYINFGCIDVTEDEVVVLYWDSSWHKVSTGIASQRKLTELEGKFKRESAEFDMPLEEVLKDGVPMPNGTIRTPVRWRNIIDTSEVAKVKITQKGSVISVGFGGYLIATYPTLEDARNNTNVIKGFTDIELGVEYVTDYEVSITAEEKYLMVLTNSSAGINVPVIKGVTEYEIEYAEKSVVDDLVVKVDGIGERLTETKEETLTNVGSSHKGIPLVAGGVQDHNRYYLIYKVNGGATCKITTNTGLRGSENYWYAIGFYATLSDAENATNPIGGVTDKDCGTTTLVNFEVDIPSGVEYITVMIGSSASASAIVMKNIQQPIDFSEFEKKKVLNSKVLWLGTSIPEGSPYPQNACKSLGVTCYNKALGSSGIIKHDGYLGNNRDGRDLAETIAEKESRYRTKVTDGTITEETLTKWKGYGFETLMIPYIDGTIDNCDVVVFDHGYNDKDNIKTELPSLATADFAIDKSDDEFDRSTFVGAFCFLVKKIWEVNPNIRIFICSFYENISTPSGRSGKNICDMQRAIANHFDFPYLDMASINGFNYERIPNSSEYINTFNAKYGTSYTLRRYAGYKGNNITRQQFYCMDGLHPHTDKTGGSEKVLTTSAIKCLRDLFFVE